MGQGGVRESRGEAPRLRLGRHRQAFISSPAPARVMTREPLGQLKHVDTAFMLNYPH